MWDTPWVPLNSVFFTKKSLSLIWVIRMKTTLQNCNSFDFYCVFKGCFNQSNYNVDDISSMIYSRSPIVNCFLKTKIWRHNFCSWCDAANKIMCLKLFCRYDYVTKVWLLKCFCERNYYNFNLIKIWPEKK